MPTLRALVLLTALFGLALPVPASAQGAGKEETPESLYERGLRQMRRSSFDEAMDSFNRVVNHFPYNQYSVLAELRVADCLYEKGDWLDAVDRYRQFRRLHPRHPEIDYVVMRTAKAYYRLAPVLAQRDQGHTRRAVSQLEGFEETFPGSEYIDEVRSTREKSVKRLTKSVAQIGHFYWKRRQYRAAERRYRQVLAEFGPTDGTELVRWRLGQALWRQERFVEGRAVLAQLAEEAADHRLGRKAAGFLDQHPTDPEPSPTEAEAPAG